MLDMTNVINPMTKAEAREWIKALRRGEYIQGKGLLRRSEGFHTSYCCLGVEAKVHNLEFFNDMSYSYLRKYSKDEEVWYRLPADVQHELAEQNDKRDWDFNQISDYIEGNILPKLKDSY